MCAQRIGLLLDVGVAVDVLRHYPRVKRAWVEYLGEHPEPALDRVE